MVSAGWRCFVAAGFVVVALAGCGNERSAFQAPDDWIMGDTFLTLYAQVIPMAR